MGMKIVIIGSSFAGLTAALELKERLGHAHDVAVISKSDRFVFLPSLVWLPFGLRKLEDISFPLVPLFRRKEIEFHNAPVVRIDLGARKVFTPRSEHAYDYLVVATGPALDYGAVPGLGPKTGFTQSVYSPEDAETAATAFKRFLQAPGPVVVGAVQGASFFGPAYEFLFNMSHQLRKRGLADKAPLAFLTAEPYLGHFGMGGLGGIPQFAEQQMQKLGVTVETKAAFREILPDVLHLANGHSFPFAYAMLTPPFLGIEALRARPEIATPEGFVRVNDYYHTQAHPEVFAAGIAVAVEPRTKTPVPIGAPKSGYMSEQMARTVAHNIAASIHGEEMITLPPESIDARYVLDAGNTGVVVTADHYLEPYGSGAFLPGPEAHWAKIAFEKYFLATRRRGRV
jgi:sulfide:quinone oxidoreductase